MVFYGFVRGTHLNPKVKVHLIGVGDYDMADISVLPDPCPLPDKERDRTTLSKKDALLFAPLSDVGAVTFDKDAVYIDIRQANYTKKENLAIVSRRKEEDDDADDDEVNEEADYDSDAPAGMLKNLQDVKTSVDEKMKKSSFRIFKGSKAIVAESSSDSEEESDDEDSETESHRRSPRQGDVVEDSDDDMESGIDVESESDSENDDEDEESSNDEVDEEENEEEGTESSADEDSSDGEDEKTSMGVNHWKSSIAERAKQSFLERESGLINLQELVYGQSERSSINNKGLEDEDESSSDDDDDDDDDEFFKPKITGSRASNSLSGSQHVEVLVLDEEDSCRMVEAPLNVTPWLEESDGYLVESIRNKFVTGNWGKEEEYGDFEDLESGEKFTSSDRDATGSVDDLPPEGLSDEQLRDYYAKKKSEQKSKFDDDYDNGKKQDGGDMNDESAENEYIEALKREKEARLARNKEEFGIDGERSRLRHEGFRQGLYCRVKIEGIPAGFVTGFDPKMPLVLGGLTTQETSLSLTRCRFKKHRWHKKILRSNDPLVFSIGWRRFQSIPVL
jgi:ribosome biogenesis protein BMS1